MDESSRLNHASWEERAPAHAASPDYGLDRLVGDPRALSDVVRFDLPRLGDVAGLRGVHLQCHIGTDTLSLARLGAQMTGLDFSGAALAEARRLAERAGEAIDFVEGDVHDAADLLGRGSFDLVYTGVGALNWLPSARRWAQVVAALLRPGGRLVLREGHPVLLALDDPREDGLLVLEHPYVEREEPIVWEGGGTYVETDATFTQNVVHEWNHGLGEVVTALLQAGMRLTGLQEHDTVPWDALPGRMEQVAQNEWRLRDRPWRLPHSYSLQAVREG